jgi:hypothetical protein
MKKLLVTFLFLLLATFANAQPVNSSPTDQRKGTDPDDEEYWDEHCVEKIKGLVDNPRPWSPGHAFMDPKKNQGTQTELEYVERCNLGGRNSSEDRPVAPEVLTLSQRSWYRTVVIRPLEVNEKSNKEVQVDKLSDTEIQDCRYQVNVAITLEKEYEDFLRHIRSLDGIIL